MCSEAPEADIIHYLKGDDVKRMSSPASGNRFRSRRSSCKSFVDRLQRIRIRDVPLIEGLDKVIFGTLSAAEAVFICGIKPPQYLFYMLSGAVCDVIQLLMDCLLHFGFGIEDASMCWIVSFVLSIVFRHTSHRYLAFGDYVGGYWNSLLRMYGGYSVIIVLSTLFNIVMTKMARFPHYVAWIVTLLWTGIVNYFILKKLWTFGGTSTSNSKASQGTPEMVQLTPASRPSSTSLDNMEAGRDS
jgi:putative flippase GtrA